MSRWGVAKPVCVEGIWFASIAEASRYAELRLLERAGVIVDLRPHPRYPLIVNGADCGTVVPDFDYYDNEKGVRVVEDVKSPVSRTSLFKLKKKLFRAVYGFDIVEIPS